MESIKVFQELVLKGSDANRDLLKSTLIASKVPLWCFDKVATDNTPQNITPQRDVIVFHRSKDVEAEAANLVLLERDIGYYVPNIVPTESRELSMDEYNAVLKDFAKKIAKPAAKKCGFTVKLTKPFQTLADWLSPQSAEALRVFSSLANKGSGSANPLDQQRWHRFIIAVYKSRRSFDAGMLDRWLKEVGHWHEDDANKLVIECEQGLALLKRYNNRS